MTGLRTYLETAPKRTFAGAIDWPGWERSGRDEAAALDALVAAGPRYVRALGAAALGLEPPATADAIDIVERRRGDSGTEFGVPSVGPSSDGDDVTADELARLVAILAAAWRAFDDAVEGARGRTLRTGPRGGGRDLAKLMEHVMDAEGAYLDRLGGRHRPVPGEDPTGRHQRLRAEIVDLLGSRVRGEPVDLGRRRAPLWTPRYAVRRSAWHALDHAWEIEDRAERP